MIPYIRYCIYFIVMDKKKIAPITDNLNKALDKAL